MEKLDDLREVINVDNNLKKLGYQQLADMYHSSSSVWEDYRGFPIKEQIRSTSDLSLLYDEEVARNSKIILTETQGNAQNSRYSSIKINTKVEKKQMKGSPRKGSPERSSSEITWYRYTYFPKLLNELVDTPEVIKDINWPPIAFASSSGGYLHDVFKPKGTYYTKENINEAIWLASWISTYWYHENTEKRIHIVQLLNELPKMIFTSRQKELILSQIVDNIEAYGTPIAAAENLSYLLHCLFRPSTERSILSGYSQSQESINEPFSVDWRHQNQLMFWFHKLALGNPLKVCKPRERSLNFDRRGSSISANFNMVPYPFKKSSEVEKKPDFISCWGHAETKSISIPVDRKKDFVEDKIEKANIIANRRGEINRIK